METTSVTTQFLAVAAYTIAYVVAVIANAFFFMKDGETFSGNAYNLEPQAEKARALRKFGAIVFAGIFFGLVAGWIYELVLPIKAAMGVFWFSLVIFGFIGGFICAISEGKAFLIGICFFYLPSVIATVSIVRLRHQLAFGPWQYAWLVFGAVLVFFAIRHAKVRTPLPEKQ